MSARRSVPSLRQCLTLRDSSATYSISLSRLEEETRDNDDVDVHSLTTDQHLLTSGNQETIPDYISTHDTAIHESMQGSHAVMPDKTFKFKALSTKRKGPTSDSDDDARASTKVYYCDDDDDMRDFPLAVPPVYHSSQTLGSTRRSVQAKASHAAAAAGRSDTVPRLRAPALLNKSSAFVYLNFSTQDQRYKSFKDIKYNPDIWPQMAQAGLFCDGGDLKCFVCGEVMKTTNSLKCCLTFNPKSNKF